MKCPDGLSGLLALGLLVLATLACSNGGGNTNNAGTANTGVDGANTANSQSAKTEGVYVESVWLARDDGSNQHGEKVTGFKPTDNPQHIVVKLSEIESGTKLGFKMIAVNAGGEKNFKVLEQEMTTNAMQNQVDFKATLPNPWPVGDYKAEIYLNGKLAKTVEYKVQQ